MAKSNEVYAAEERLKKAERELEDAIKYDRPAWKVKDLRKEVDSAKGILRTAERRR